MATSYERRTGFLAGWSTRDIVVTAAVAVVIGLLFAVWTQVYNGFDIAVGKNPVLSQLAVGFWFIGGVLIPYIVRKVGSALIGELMAAAVSMLFSPWGWTVLISGLVQGIASEVPFLATRYRNFSLPILLLAGGLPALTSFAQEYVPYEYGALEPGVQIGMVVLRFISGMLLAGLLSKGIGDALAKTGVLSGFAIGREGREEV